MPNEEWLRSVGITQNDVFSWVHHKKNRSVVVEELSGKYAIFLIELNSKDIIDQIEKGIESKESAREKAEKWINNNNI
jgi:uncharacterized protein YlxP (DUF503 family)